MSVQCKNKVFYYHICGHTRLSTIHCKICPAHENEEMDCWSPIQPENERQFVNDRCFGHRCIEILQEHRTNTKIAGTSFRSMIEEYEKEHPEVGWRKIIEDRQVIEANKVEHEESIRQAQSHSRFHILDLTAPRNEILQTLVKTVRNRAQFRCWGCREMLRDGQLDKEGKPATIPNRGIARRLPCGHAFHIECLVKHLVRIPSCPICRMGDRGADDKTGEKCEFLLYIFNGFGPSIRRLDPWISSDTLCGGYVEFGAFNYPKGQRPKLELRPFVPPTENDRWGANNDEVDIKREEQEYLDSIAWVRPGADDVPPAPYTTQQDSVEMYLQDVERLIVSFDGRYAEYRDAIDANTDQERISRALSILNSTRFGRNARMNGLVSVYRNSERQDELKDRVNRCIARINEQVSDDNTESDDKLLELI